MADLGDELAPEHLRALRQPPIPVLKAFEITGVKPVDHVKADGTVVRLIRFTLRGKWDGGRAVIRQHVLVQPDTAVEFGITMSWQGEQAGGKASE